MHTQAVSEFLHPLDNLVLSVSGIENMFRASFLAQLESFVPGIDCHDVESNGVCKLNAQVAQPAPCTDNTQPSTFRHLGHDDGPVDGAARASQRRRTGKAHRIGDVTARPSIHDVVFAECAIHKHSNVALEVLAILVPIIRTLTVITLPTLGLRQTGHDAIPGFEVLDVGPRGDDDAGPLVRGRAR